MKSLRWLVVLGLIAYAGWLTVPLIEHLTGAAHLTQMPHLHAPAGLTPDPSSPLGVGLWIASIAGYVFSAILMAGESRRAFVAYLIGFAANMMLFALNAHRSGPPASFPVLFLLGALTLGGVLVLAETRSRRHAHA